MKKIKKGNIYLADMDPAIGSEQGGVRPVLVIQNNKGNKYSPTTIVACLTSRVHTKANLPTHYLLPVWLNNPPARDCVQLAPKTFNELENYRCLLTPDEQKEKMERWVLQYQTEKVAVYCNGCERGIRLGRGNPVHMVELIARDLQ